ncbi:hypothetical protein D3C72_428750 [compost metagenome]
MNQVERVSRAATQIFDDAERLLQEDFREEIAHASAAGALHSGRTVRRFIRAFEARATQAVAEARGLPGYDRSTIIRVQVARDTGIGTDRLAGVVKQGLETLTLGGRAADAILAEARQRALRDRPTETPQRRPLPAWIAWWGNHLLTALLGAAVALGVAYLIFRFGWN